jgi:hypothetical protein
MPQAQASDLTPGDHQRVQNLLRASLTALDAHNTISTEGRAMLLELVQHAAAILQRETDGAP